MFGPMPCIRYWLHAYTKYYNVLVEVWPLMLYLPLCVCVCV